MAEQFTLSTKQLNPSIATSGLNPNLLSVGASSRGGGGAIRIDPNVATIGFQPAPIPSTVEDVLSKSVTATMATLADAAFKYEQRESTFLSNEAVMEFDEFVRQRYDGYNDEDGKFIKGYSGTEAQETKDLYTPFENEINQKFNEILGNLEPRVKQKALVRMTGDKNSVMGKASVHRMQQFEIEEDRQTYRQSSQFARKFASDPSEISKIDSNTGLDGRQQYRSLFDTVEEADSAWYGLLQEIGQNIYLNEALNGNFEAGSTKARAFYEKYRGELINSPKHNAAFKENLVSWELTAVNKYNTSVTRREAAELKEKKERYAAGLRKYVEMEVRGETITMEMLLEDSGADNLSPTNMRVIAVNNGLIDATGADAINGVLITQIHNAIGSTKSSEAALMKIYDPEGIHAPDGSFETFIRMVPGLSKTDRTAAMSAYRATQGPNGDKYQANLNRALKTLKNWNSIPFRYKNQGLEDNYAEFNNIAITEVEARLNADVETYDEIMADMQKRYHQTIIDYDLLATFRDGDKPDNLPDLKVKLGKIVNMRRTGAYSNEEFAAEFRLHNQYLKVLGEKQRAFRAEEQALKDNPPPKERPAFKVGVEGTQTAESKRGAVSEDPSLTESTRPEKPGQEQPELAQGENFAETVGRGLEDLGDAASTYITYRAAKNRILRAESIGVAPDPKDVALVERLDNIKLPDPRTDAQKHPPDPKATTTEVKKKKREQTDTEVSP